MNAALAAHLRILSATPRERIRTHVRPGPELKRGGRPAGAPVEDLIDQFRRMKREGLAYEEIRASLGIGTLKMQRLTKIATPNRASRERARRLAISENMRKMRADPEFARKQAAAVRAMLEARNADPEWKARNMERLRAGLERAKRERAKP